MSAVIRLPLPERLHRVALELKAHEVEAEPGSPERVLRGLRADRMAGLAWEAIAGQERHSQPEQRQAGAVEAAYPEASYQQLAEGLSKLAAGRHAQPEQQQAQRDAATCTNCGVKRANPRLKCTNCGGPVCVQCAVYDEDGDLFCPECYAGTGGAFNGLRMGS